MMIGSLGNIIFEIKDDMIQTFQKFERSGGARVSEHNRHGAPALAEFTGSSARKATLTFRCAAFLGSKPIFEINRIENYARNGTLLQLFIGKQQIGYRWLVQSYKISAEHYDQEGMITDFSASVSLIECGKE